MKVKQVGSNMTELEANGKTVLFSYQTPVACYIADEGCYYRTTYKWSQTTSRHINKWLDGAMAEERPQEFFDDLLE